MASDSILRCFDDLGIWKQGDQRAPHKPLLVLYALGRWQAGQKDIGFRLTEPDLTGLLREFGPLGGQFPDPSAPDALQDDDLRRRMRTGFGVTV